MSTCKKVRLLCIKHGIRKTDAAQVATKQLNLRI